MSSIEKVLDNIESTGMLPIIFAGSGVTKRYTSNKYDWKELLIECISEYANNPVNKYKEYEVDVKYNLDNELGKVDKFSIYERIGTIVERDFNKAYYRGEIKSIDVEENSNPLKVFISQKLSNYSLDYEMKEEISLFKKLKEKMLTVVTTNYDTFFEDHIFTKHEKIIGQNIFKKSELGTLIKIHGCVSQPESIVLTSRDYNMFKRKRRVLSAKLISLFSENPVIFMGYSVTDENIRSILLDIFQCIEEEWEFQEFEKRLIIIDYDESIDRHIVGSHSMLIEDVEISLTKITTSSYYPILKEMQRLKKKVRFRDLMPIKDILYDVVHDSEGRGKRLYNLIDGDVDSDVDGDEVIVAITKKEALLDSVGITGIQADELFDDVLTDSLDSKIRGREKLLVENQLPILFRSNVVLPVHKYLKQVGIDEDVNLMPSVENMAKKELEDLLNNSIKQEYEKYRKNNFNSLDEIFKSDNGMHRKLNFLVLRSLYDAEPEEIKDFLLKHKDEIISFSNGRTMLRKMICSYDIKKYKTPRKGSAS